MTHLRRNRILACAGVRTCRSQENEADNNRRGQDKSDGPAGVYAVVVLWFSAALAPGRSAASGRKRLRALAFLGTNTVPPSP